MKKALLLIPALFIFLSLSSPTFANNSFKDTLDNFFRNFQNRNSTNAALQGPKCFATTGKINGRIAYIKTRQKLEERRNKNTQNRLSKLITKANSLNVNTTTLSSDLTTLTSKVATLSTDYNNLIAKLEELKTKTCGSDDFKNTLSQAKTLYQKVQTDLKDLRDFYKKLKTDVKNLRSNLPQKLDLQKDSDNGFKDHSSLDKLDL